MKVGLLFYGAVWLAQAHPFYMSTDLIFLIKRHDLLFLPGLNPYSFQKNTIFTLITVGYLNIFMRGI